MRRAIVTKTTFSLTGFAGQLPLTFGPAIWGPTVRRVHGSADDSALDLEAIRTVPCRPWFLAGAPRSPGVLWSRLWTEVDGGRHA